MYVVSFNVSTNDQVSSPVLPVQVECLLRYMYKWEAINPNVRLQIYLIVLSEAYFCPLSKGGLGKFKRNSFIDPACWKIA